MNESGSSEFGHVWACQAGELDSGRVPRGRRTVNDSGYRSWTTVLCTLFISKAHAISTDTGYDGEVGQRSLEGVVDWREGF